MYFFFNLLPSNTKGFDNHSYEWRGFWSERWKIFYLKRWMTYVCITWYDVWNTLCMNFSFSLFLKTNSNWFPFHFYFKSMESFYFDIFYFSKSFLWSNQFTKTLLFNHFFWNTIWMTCMKLPRAWKGLDEVMKIN